MNIIFDLDGTLSDTSHRQHFVERPNSEKDWASFNKSAKFDKPITPICTTFFSLNSTWLGNNPNKIQIWSGRGEEVRADTERWLANEIGWQRRFVPLKMRAVGDYTPDDELKERWLMEAKAEGFWPDLVFDDRQRVVDMWRRHGIICCQVAPGQF